MINDNAPFREWTSTRLMPYIDYFSVPLSKKNIGNPAENVLIIRMNDVEPLPSLGHGMIIFPPHYSPNKTIASYPVIISM